MVFGVWILVACGIDAAAADTLDGLSAFTQGEYAEALHAWQDAADKGDANGALYTGVLYDAGQGVRQDYAQALHWYRRAAALGSAAGTFNVGVMYDAGRGVAPDPAQAAVWYARAARLGYARADYNLALLYENGIGVRRDRGRAARLYQTAARLGLKAAQFHLAALGNGPAGPIGKQNDTSMQDFADAQSALLARGAAKTGLAVQLFRRAAEQGNAMAEYDLGYCLESGIGTAPNRLEAYIWYSRAAAEAGDPQLHAIAYGGVMNIEHQLTPAELQQAKRAIAAAALKANSSRAAAAGR